MYKEKRQKGSSSTPELLQGISITATLGLQSGESAQPPWETAQGPRNRSALPKWETHTRIYDGICWNRESEVAALKRGLCDSHKHQQAHNDPAHCTLPPAAEQCHPRLPCTVRHHSKHILCLKRFKLWTSAVLIISYTHPKNRCSGIWEHTEAVT